RWLVQLHGAATLEIEDAAGRRLGPGRDELPPEVISVQIPGASYSPGMTFSSALLVAPDRYIIRVSTTSGSTVSVRITEFAGAAEMGTVLWHSLSFDVGTRARIALDTTDPLRREVLTLEAPDEAPEEIEPTRLTASENRDTFPPTTEVRIEDGTVIVSA